ncbi:hypothetical protein A1A1_08179 [Planococcus antarcticus DSM 14505]|uniref:DinB-like domain-containing protein n=2 Tax=Planococcus TaxID=1372 RepID=A0A1C7DJS2_9BACL|nr:DinB family protein [Planococcus antarcticus]ANU11830.1 hypothetical protein BBH88_17020 [Planococcus antarcticus DSM 14505]EIM06930.1 hypothetical protein A1A1_08179 [Planococcus antarcticus DSM 14505]
MSNRYLQNGLQGKYAHYQTDMLFNGLSWEVAGEKPEDSHHSVWELLFHMNYWQDFILAELQEVDPGSPKDPSDSWPGSPFPSSEKEYTETVTQFLKGLGQATQQASKDSLEQGIGGRKRTPADLLMVLINHNSYHGGQVVYARRLIGAWPPPDGDKSGE